MKRASKNFGIYLLIFMIVLGAAYLYRGMDNPASTKEIKFSQFVEQLDGKKYESLNITDRKLSGTKKNGNVEFAYAPSVVEISWVEEHYINSMLEKHQITLESDPPESSVNFFSLLPTIIMVVALVFLFYFMMSQGGNNKAFQFGKNRAKLYKDIKIIINKYGSLDMGQVDVAEFIQELLEVMKNNRIVMPHGLTMLARGITQIEGVLADIAPGINMVGIASARIKQEMFKNFDFRGELKKAGKTAYKSAHRMLGLPERLAQILEEYQRGQTRINLDMHASEELARLLHRLVRNIVMGLWRF